jgi:Mce-associated membrane protein
MAGTPRKPIRPAGPRGKIRVAGSSPSVRKADPAADTAPDEAVTSETTSAEPEATATDTATEPAQIPESDATESTGVESGTAGPTSSASDSTDDDPAAPSGETVKLDKPAAKSRPKVKGASLKKPGAEQSGSEKSVKAADPRAVKTSTGFLTWRKVAVVALIAIVVAIFAVVAAFKPGASMQSNKAFIDSSQTSELKAQAGDRICAVLSIDPTKFDDWADKAKTGLTGQALTEFNEYQSTSRDLAAQSGQGAECKVDLVAVSNMDSSTATVIATVLISTTQQGVAVLSGPGQARTELGMQKIDGQWRISRISDF